MNIIVYILNLAFIVLLVYGLYKKNKQLVIARFFFPALILKLMAGIGLGLIFKYHYQYGDTITYFKEASRFADLAVSDFGEYLKVLFGQSGFKTVFDRQPRALLFTQITSIFAVITNKNYWLISLYFSLFSFFCFWLFARRLSSIYENKAAILISLFLFPSVVFWSSGLMKESLAIGFIALLLSSTLGYVYNQKKWQLHLVLIDLVVLFFLWKLKYYYAAVLVLMLVVLILVLVLSNRLKIFQSAWVQLITIIFFCVAGTYIISFIHPNFNLDRVAHVIVKNHNILLDKSAPSEIIHFNNLTPTVESLIINSPKALFSGFFRPLPGDSHGLLSWVTKIENSLLLIFTLLALWNLRKIPSKHSVLIFSSIVYCIFLATFLALSTPNFGTLMRFKLGFLPVLLLLITIPNPLIKRLDQWLFQ